MYQVPFCQVLGLKGYKVLHLSSHGVAEHGKDIIALDENNVACAFQLKTGDINSSEWRKIHGEITELIEFPIDYPSIKNSVKHRAFLVTNGRISEDVRLKISALNRGNRRRKLPVLEIITKDRLLSDFINAQGTFLPHEPKELQDFLELYLSNGKANLEEEKFSGFLQGTLFTENRKLNTTTAMRKIASALLLLKYALAPYEKVNNHISIIKGWILFCSYMLALVEKNKLPQKCWKPSYQLCWHALYEQLKEFKEEILKRNNKFLEGDLKGEDKIIYKTRVTIILGWFAAFELIQKQKDDKYILDKRLYDLICCNFPDNFHFWGESASCCFVIVGLFLSLFGEKDMASKIFKDALSSVAIANNLESEVGLPDPYYSVDQVLNCLFQLPDSEIDLRSFVGTSYTIKVLIECLVRENRRDILEVYWRPISLMQYCEFNPEPVWQTYFWRNIERGVDNQKAFDSSQSWDKLKQEAYVNPSSLPKLITKDRSFLLLFLLTFPHRVKSDMVKLIDRNFYNSEINT